jgi:hypothetical protein
MKRAALLLFVALGMSATPTAESFDAHVWNLQQHWDRFLRAYWGCAPDAHRRLDCNSTLSRIDRKEFEASRRAAFELFEK